MNFFTWALILIIFFTSGFWVSQEYTLYKLNQTLQTKEFDCTYKAPLNKHTTVYYAGKATIDYKDILIDKNLIKY